MYNMNDGYCGWSMSNRAVEAYENGEKPISKFKKADFDLFKKIIFDAFDCEIEGNMNNFKEYLKCYCQSSWHHTGKYCKKTYFYDFVSHLTNYSTGHFDVNDDYKDIICEFKKEFTKENLIFELNYYFNIK